MPGLFVTFEGIEGSGKTTLAGRLVGALRAEGREVVDTHEPGGTPLGCRIRDLVLGAADPLPDRAELLLFAADRALHVDGVIRPALDAGRIVVSDRFADSTRAYQGSGRGIGRDLIERALALATGGLVPDLTLLVDVDVPTSRRRKPPKDRMEQAPDAFFERVRVGFLGLQRGEPERIRLLDGCRPVDELAAEILDLVHQRLA